MPEYLSLFTFSQLYDDNLKEILKLLEPKDALNFRKSCAQVNRAYKSNYTYMQGWQILHATIVKNEGTRDFTIKLRSVGRNRKLIECPPGEWKYALSNSQIRLVDLTIKDEEYDTNELESIMGYLRKAEVKALSYTAPSITNKHLQLFKGFQKLRMKLGKFDLVEFDPPKVGELEIQSVVTCEQVKKWIEGNPVKFCISCKINKGWMELAEELINDFRLKKTDLRTLRIYTTEDVELEKIPLNPHPFWKHEYHETRGVIAATREKDQLPYKVIYLRAGSDNSDYGEQMEFLEESSIRRSSEFQNSLKS